jgi:beta-glucosidase
MCAYNKVNGEYASENKKLLTDIPRGEWGFEGLIMSDWGAVNDRVAGLNAGLDLEMPGDILHNNQLIIDAVREGRISEEVLNTSVRRVLTMVKNGLEGARAVDNPLEEDSVLSGDISREGAVLLKNEGNALPLSKNDRFLVIGEMFEKMRYQGAGSSLLRPYKLITPKDAFDKNGVNYEYAKGYKANNPEINSTLEADAMRLAKDAQTILFFGGLTEDAESEGFDRENMLLPENQRSLLTALTTLGKKVIFVMYGGSPVELDCAEGADAILNMYLPGQEGGRSTYELLFGLASPSGRLSESWPYHYSDVPFGAELAKTTNDVYKESIFVGYRYYTTFGVPVRYPFGYGLSYTTFSYRDMTLERVGDEYKIGVTVKNDGQVAGSEVVEVFVEAPKSDLVKPLRELRGYEKVHLAPGEEKTVTVTVPVENMKYYVDGAWRLEGGEYKFQICKDVNTVILEAEATIDDGETLASPENVRALYATKESLLSITDGDFEGVIGRPITLKKTARPYDLNTPMREFETIGGKLFFGTIIFVFKTILKLNSLAKDGPDKETKIKNTYFGMRTIQAMSLRSLSYASEGMLSHRMAEGILDIANNKPLRGIAKLITPEKCVKLPE